MKLHLNTFKVIIFFLIALFACNRKPAKDQNRKALARVNDSYLYEDAVNALVPYSSSSNDSLEFIKKYTNNWIHEELLLQQAENNLTDDKKNVEKQLENYRNSLITFAYEKELVSQKLDTTVTEGEIEEYYSSNKDNFELKDNIIRVIYVKVNKTAPDIKNLEAWYKSDSPKDKELLASYCYQFAANFYLDDSTWLFFDDLLKEIPINTYNKELFLQNNRLVEVSDSTYNYFVNIKGFKIRNSLSPISLERENIKNIILNRRKIQLIAKMKEDIYTEAMNTKKIELYINDKTKE